MCAASLTVRSSLFYVRDIGGKQADTANAFVHVALQIGDKYRVTTPVNWKKGDDVIVHPSVSNEEAKTLFPDFTIHKVRPQH